MAHWKFWAIIAVSATTILGFQNCATPPTFSTSTSTEATLGSPFSSINTDGLSTTESIDQSSKSPAASETQ
jgi:hypothetical protein